MTTNNQLKRYKDNPFIENMELNIKSRPVRVAPLGKNATIVNPDTGEISGTHVVTYKRVDSSRFVKLFTDNIKLTFGLTASGTKALHVVMWEVQRNGFNRTWITLDSMVLADFMEADASNGLTMSERTFHRGLTELCKAEILARAARIGEFHLNPNFIFNGDRIAFTTMIERTSNT